MLSGVVGHEIRKRQNNYEEVFILKRKCANKKAFHAIYCQTICTKAQNFNLIIINFIDHNKPFWSLVVAALAPKQPMPLK